MGSFNHWQPQKMQNAYDLAKSLMDTEKALRVHKLTCKTKVKGKPTPDSEIVESYLKKEWQNILLRNIGGFLDAVIVDGTDGDVDASEVFVHFTFLKLQKYTYTVNYQGQFYLHKCVSRAREERLPPVFNTILQKQKEG